jgi:hypothetical protein
LVSEASEIEVGSESNVAHLLRQREHELGQKCEEVDHLQHQLDAAKTVSTLLRFLFPFSHCMGTYCHPGGKQIKILFILFHFVTCNLCSEICIMLLFYPRTIKFCDKESGNVYLEGLHTFFHFHFLLYILHWP